LYLSIRSTSRQPLTLISQVNVGISICVLRNACASGFRHVIGVSKRDVDERYDDIRCGRAI
jgi:hypothetical protein